MALTAEEVRARLAAMSPQQRRMLLKSIPAKPRRVDAIPRYPEREILPQSYSQRRLWYLYRIDPATSMYNMPESVRLAGALDLADLERAFNDVIARHSALRTVFADDERGPIQRILPPRHHPIELIDLEEAPQDTIEERVKELAHQVSDRPFDLVNGPVVKMTAIRLSPTDHVVVINMHHIVSDGWSVSIFVRDVFEYYLAYRDGRTPHLPELPIEFLDFVQWQIERLSGPALEKQLGFWRSKLSALEPLALPFDRAPSRNTTARGGYQQIELPKDLHSRLLQITRDCGCTLFMAVLAAFKVLLHRYSGQTDINVGVPIAGRNRLETEHMIGFFANTSLVRTDLGGEPTFRELIERLRDSALGAFAHDEAPFEKLVEMLQPERDLSRNPLFQLMFILQNTTKPRMDVPGLIIDLLDSYNSTVKFDMLVEFYEANGGLTGGLGYRADLFDEATIRPFAQSFARIVTAMCDDLDAKIGDCELAPAGGAGAALGFADVLE